MLGAVGEEKDVVRNMLIIADGKLDEEIDTSLKSFYGKYETKVYRPGYLALLKDWKQRHTA